MQEKYLNYKKIRAIPIAGDIFRIANAYVYEGKVDNHGSIAPLSLWLDKIGKKLLYTLILTVILSIICWLFLDVNWDAADAIISVFPSLLGFGIGVFALLFILPNRLYQLLDKEKENGNIKFGHEILAVDMGYPLLVFAVILTWSGVNKFIDIAAFNFVSKWLFFYGMSMVLELISFLFNISMLIMNLKIKP
ncbi:MULTISPECIES: hypothetical protein [Proteus]|jgi:hypothetical protein|uniref:Uncharacterized protein n=1 Tax=Proteus mirabilis TaxID=584 RepID=A0AAN3YZR1_PROMI|nr:MULTISPECIES: hypothetical protein [Proteus]AUT92405.1 hypothetical protein MC46_012000 [Proteus mirabilis]EHZ8013220.1 hypothetical protein [Proteus mirabilis]EKU7612897.1 hypothetical protein [Proteus mirabilis]EKV0743643.1 hypothetical protein [Proteus mirabilis]EKV2708357.1 hypothetical protein [Proteus mirabilis]